MLHRSRLLIAFVLATAMLAAPAVGLAQTTQPAEATKETPAAPEVRAEDKANDDKAAADKAASELAADQARAKEVASKVKNTDRGTIRFQFDGVDYKDVIRRFVQIADKPIIGDYNVPGKLTFFDSRKYSFEEAFDTLNIILEMRGFALVEEERWFRLVELTNIGSKSKILKGLDTADAKEMRASEVATVVLPLKFIDAGTASKAVVRWVSSWGSISVLAKGKGIIITDRLSRIKRIRDLLKMLDTESLVQRQMKTYQLKHASAKNVSEMINKLFGSSRQMVYNPQAGRYEPQNTGTSVTAVSDERTNSILLLGAGDQLALAEQVMQKLDRKEGAVGGDVRIFELKKAQAQDIAKTVNAVVQGTAKKVRGKKTVIAKEVKVVADEATNRVVVTAPVDEMNQVADLITRLDEATKVSGGAKIFRLKHADAAQLAGVVTNAVSKRDSRGRRISGLTVSVDSRNNALIIAGAGGDIDTAAQLIEQLDVKPTTEAREVHVVHLENGDAREIGRALEQTFASETRDSHGRVRRKSNIQVSADRSSNTLIISAAGGEWPRVQEVLEKLQAKAQNVATPSTRLIALEHAKADELVRTLNEIFSPRRRGRRRGSSDAPVIITSSQRSNSLLVSAAEDDQAKIAELVNRLDVPSSEKIEPFLMIRLQSADAEALAAKIMSMLPRPRRGQPQDVYLQPDRLTNSILLRASEEKRKLIEDILTKLDKATQAEARETRTVQLKHTSADAMAQVLGQMFSGGSTRSHRGRWSRSAGTDADRVVITPAPGDKTLVIDAPRSKMAEITNLIATLDTDESGGQTEVRTYQLTNSSAQEIARSLARLFGSSRRRRGRGSVSTEPDPRFEADSGTNQVLIAATPGQFEQIEPLIEKLTKSAAVAMKARLFKLQYVKAEDMVPVLETTLAGTPSGRRGRGGGGGSVRIATMKLANTIILQAPPAKVALAEELIKSFDTEDSGLQTTIEIVQLVNAQAETLTDTMNAVLASQGGGGNRRRRWRAPQDSGQGVSVTAETNSNSIIVRGPAVDVDEAVAMVRKIDADAASMTVETKTFKLKHTKAKDLVGVLQEMVTGQQASRSRWGRRRGGNTPQIAISAVGGANAIVVKAPAAEMELATKLIAEFDREDSGAAVDLQIVRLVNAEAATLADAVNATIGGQQQSRRWGRRAAPQSDNERVVVIPESNSNSVLVRGPKAQVPEVVEMVKKIDADSTTLASQTRTFKLKFVKVEDILPVLQELTADTGRSRYRRRGSTPSGQMRIASMKAANSLVIQGPPDKLAMAEELIRTFDTEDSGVRTTVEVVQLENAEAASLADSVNASIRKEATGNRRRYGRRGPTPGTDAVLVTPETNSNNVIVRGPALDVADAVAMIRKLDADAGAASGETKTFKLRHAKASDLVPMLESMIAGSTSGRSRWGRRSTSSKKEVRISAVSGSNAVVVKAPAAEMELATKLIAEFDREETDSAIETQIVRLVNAEAASLADAVNATLGGQQPSPRRWGRRSTPEAASDRVVVIPESNSNSVLVRGRKADVPAVVEMVKKIDADSTTLASQTRTFKLKFVKVDDILPVLEQLTASTNIRPRYNRHRSTASGQVRIAAMKAANTVVVQGPPDKLAMAEELVATFDTKDSGIQTTIEVVQLENAKADTLAEAVNATLQKKSSSGGRRWGRSSQPEPDTVLVSPETNSNSVIVRGPSAGVTETVAMIRKLDADAGAVAGETKTFKLQHAKAKDLVEMLESMLTGSSSRPSRWGRRRSSGDAEIRISAVSGANAIVVKAPPAELSLAEALIKEFDTDESGTQPKVQLIRLENADAESLAQTVNATISGESGGRRRWNRRGASGDEDKVVVIAETNSNSVIVRGLASQVPDVVTMVRKIDAESGGQAVITRTFRLEHAKAADLVSVLQEIVTGAQQRRSRWGRRSSQGGQMRISAVASANAIVVKAPQKDMTLAEQLIEQFDAADSGAAPAVEIVRLQNAEASSLADAVNATIAGRSSGRRRWGRASSDSDDKVVVIAENNSNSVIVRGPRSEVPAVVEMVRSLDDDSTTLAIRTHTFQLEHAKADDIVTVLEPMLTGTSGGRSRYRRAPMTRGVARVVAMSSTNAVVVQGTPEKIALAEELIKQFDSKDQARSAIRIVRLKKATAESLARSVNEALSEKGGRYRRSSGGSTVSVTAESNSNSVLVRGPSSLVDETVVMIKELDGDSEGGDVQIRVYPLKNSEAEQLARSVGKLFQDIIRQQQRGRRGTPTVPFSVTADTRTNSLVVSTTPAHFALVDDMLAKLDKEEERSERDVEYVWLENADAATVASQLESMFKDRRSQERPVIEADYFTNALTLIGKDVDLKAMRQIIEKLDQAAKDNNIRVRVVTLKDARAEKMAELIREMYGQMTESEIVVTDKLPETDRKNGKKETNESPIQLPNFAPDPDAEDDADANQPAPKVSDAGKEKILDVSRPKVTIAVDKRTNALIISGTRRELDNIESLINQLAASEGALEAELKVFKVVQADPVTVASTLDSLFNPVKTKQQLRNRKKGEPAPAPVKPDVTVVPDVRTKSVIVRAKPDDMELIEPLIAKLDKVSTIVSEVRIFKVENTDAEDVAANLRELFRLSASQGSPARSKGRNRNTKTPNQTRAEAIRQVIELKRKEGVARVDASTQVSITANNRTNSVIVAAPAEAMGLIGGMIQELDQSAATTQAAVRMYPLQHAEVKATVATLQEIFRARQDRRGSRRGATGGQDEPVIITGDTRGGQVVVSAPVDKHELIAKVVADLDNAKSDEKLLVKVYKIVNADAQGIASAIASALEVSADTGRRRRGSQDDDGGVRLSADRSSNAIVARASNKDHERIAALIEQMDVTPGDDAAVQVIQLTKGDPEVIAETLNRLFGAASGRGRRRGGPAIKGVVIEADKSSRTLMVRADEATFQRIRTLAVKLDTGATGDVKRTILAVENGSAVTIASALQQAFAPQGGGYRYRRSSDDEQIAIVPEPASNSLIVTANDEDLGKVKALLSKLDSESAEGTRTEFVVLKYAKAEQMAGVLSAVSGGTGGSRRGRHRSTQTSATGVTISADTSANALVMNGPSKELDRLMAMAMKLDSAAEGKTQPVFKTYAVKKADVSSMVTALQEVFGDDSRRGRRRGDSAEVPVVIVADETGSRVVVSASQEKHKLISGIISDLDSEETGSQVVVRVYKLKHGEARSLGWTLQNAWQKQQRGRGGSTDQTRITGDSSSNSIVVRAAGRDQTEIARLIQEMDAPADVAFPVQAIPLNNAEPTEVARVLQSVFDAAGGRRRGGWGVKKQTVVIEASDDSRLIMVRADEKTFAKVRELAAQLDQETSGKATRTILPLEWAQADSVASALTRAFQPPRGQKVGPDEQVGVVAESGSNSIIVTANEKNLARVKELLTDLDKEGSRRSELLLLQHAKATELADVLAKAAGVSSGGRRRGRGGSTPQGVVVTADGGSNALVMTGPTGEIDKLMKMALQLDQATQGAQPGVFIIGLKNSYASDIARMIENLYRTQADAARKEKKNIDPLGVSADERANAVVLATSKEMYQTVSKWVEEVEALKPDRGATRIISLENADPAEVEKVIQQMLEKGGAMQVRRRGRNDRSGSQRVKTSVLENQRSIMVEASDEDFEAIMKVVAALDEAAADAKKVVKIYNLENATNTQVAAALGQVYRATRETSAKDVVTVTALRETNAVVVSAAKEKMQEVAHLIEQLDKKEVAPQVEIRIYPLTNAQPEKIVDPLRKMLQQVVRTRQGESIDVQADQRTKSIIVTAKADFFDQVGKVIELLDKKPAYAKAQVLILPLKRADATQLAAVLNDMLRPVSGNQVTPEARALQEQVRLLRVRSAIKDGIPELDLTKPIKVSADPARPQGSNSLIISSTEDNITALREIVSILDAVPVTEGTKVRLLHLKNADAQVVQTILQDIFVKGRQLAGRQGSTVQGKAEPKSTSGRALVNVLNISADLRTNTLVLSGLEESLALAEAIVADLDEYEGRIVTDVKAFRLKHGDAGRIAGMLVNVFRETPDTWLAGARTYVSRLRIALNDDKTITSKIPKNRTPLSIQADPETNIILVAARSDLMPLVSEAVQTLDIPSPAADAGVRVVPLENADASRVQQVIERLFESRTAGLRRAWDIPTIALDTRTNSLVINASERTHAMLDGLIKKLDGKQEVDVRDINILPLENAEASQMADTLQKMMDARVQRQAALGVKDAESLRVIILADPRSNSLVIGGSKESFAMVSELARQMDQTAAAIGGQIQTIELQEANAGTLATTLMNLFNQRYAAARTADVARQKPIILPDLRTNSLLVSANKDDSKVLQGLLKKLDVKLTDPAVQLVVIPMEHNDAEAIGPTIQQIFQARLASMTAQGQTPSPQDKVDVATDVLSNSLIVSASKENLTLIRGLLEKIDVEPASKTGVIRMYALRNASAARVAGMLKGLLNQGLYKPGLVAAGNNQARAAMEQVAIEIDTRTNVLIVSASKENFAVIEEIIKKVDDTNDYAEGGDIRMYPMASADATKLAPMLQQFLTQKRQAEITAGGSDLSLPTTIIADARTNTLLVAGSRENFQAVETMVKRLDGKEVAKATGFEVFELKHATATVLQGTLQKLFEGRIERGNTKNPVTVLADTKTNSLIIGAGGDEMKIARELVKKLDVEEKKTDGGDTMRIFPLAKADASQVAETLKELYPAQDGTEQITVSVDERINAVIVTAGGNDLKRITELVEKLDRPKVTRVTEIRVFTLKNAEAQELATILTETLTNKPKAMTNRSPNLQNLLQFVTKTKEGKELITSALQEGVLITADPRTNSLIVTAPSDNMPLLNTLISTLDSTSPRTAEIQVFKLDNADCRSMAEVLVQLFKLQVGDGQTGKSVKYTLVSEQKAPSVSATLGNAEQHALSVTVDVRTNSLLVGGTKQYVQLASEVIRELDASPGQERQTKVYRLRNAQAEEIEETLQNFLDRERQRLQATLGEERMVAAQRLIEREVTVVAEATTNTLLLSASPRYFKTIAELIAELDQPPPQVLIQVLLAEITLDDKTDVGFDWNYANEKDGRTYTASTNFGVEAGVDTAGGFNLSVTGSDLSFFFRALKSQGRLNVLQRPQIVAADNQAAEINVGQRVPFITNSRITDDGDVINTVQYEDVAIALSVTPRINIDGFVKLDVDQKIESLSTSTIQITEGVNAVIVNSRQATTTVTVQDGHTILIGGLITSEAEDTVSKVPVLGDVPLVGNLFKSTQQRKKRTELLIVLTPKVLRTVEDADDITDPQIKRMNHLRKLNSGDIKDAAFELLGEEKSKVEPMLEANPDEPEPTTKPAEVKVPVEMLPELYRLHKELQEKKRKGRLKKDLAEEMRSREADREALAE